MNKNKFINNLKKLISFKTISGKNPQEFKKAFSWLKAFFKDLPVDFIEKGKEHKFLIIKPQNSKKTKIMGLGHIDVVPGPDKLFEMKQKSGWVYGRGVSDMKTQDLVMMTVFRNLLKKAQAGDFWLVFTNDEEIGGRASKALVKFLTSKNLIPETLLVPDGGSRFNCLSKTKGGVFFKAISTGKSAHASRPWQGKNAIINMFKFYQELAKDFPNPQKETDWRPSFSLNTIKAEGAYNMIPDKCEAEFDFRLTEQLKPQDFLQKAQKLAKKYQIKLEIYSQDPAFVLKTQSQSVKALNSAVKRVAGRPIKFKQIGGMTDARFFTDTSAQILIICHYAEGWHQIDERAELNSIWKFYKIVKQLAEELT